MITTPMKCKICGKVISPPNETPILGQPPQARNARILHALVGHMQSKADAELKDALSLRPHANAMIEATVAAQNLNGALVIGCFEISPDMEAERASVLRRVHEMTRTVRMTDEQLYNELLTMGFNPEYRSKASPEYRALQDLRDRYESLGEYAPATPENKPELVKP